MASIGRDGLATSCIPDVNRIILTCRGDAFPIGGPCNRPYPAVVTAIGHHFGLFARIPDVYLTPASSGQVFSIGGPGHGSCPICGNRKAEMHVPGAGFPDVDAIVRPSP